MIMARPTANNMAETISRTDPIVTLSMRRTMRVEAASAAIVPVPISNSSRPRGSGRAAA
jgi:hypothetical protein